MDRTMRRLASVLATSAMMASCAPVDRDVERGRMISSMKAAASDVPMLRDDPTFRAAVAAEAHLPREDFVPRTARAQAYVGAPLEIGWGQTISDPYVMAIMTASVKVVRGSRVLEIGTGPGIRRQSWRSSARTCRRSRSCPSSPGEPPPRSVGVDIGTSRSVPATASRAGPNARPSTPSWSRPDLPAFHSPFSISCGSEGGW